MIKILNNKNLNQNLNNQIFYNKNLKNQFSHKRHNIFKQQSTRSNSNSISLLSKRLIFLVFFILLFGILFIFNATYIQSNQIYNIPWYYSALQLAWSLIGTIAFFIFYNLEFSKLQKLSIYLYFLTLFFLFILFVASILPCNNSYAFAPCINGANRWLQLPFNLPFVGSLSFQPGELAKLSIILFLSFQLANNKANKNLFLLFIYIVSPVILLILSQPNMSTAVMILAISVGIYFVSASPLKPLIYIFPFILIILFLLIFLSPYRKERFLTYIKANSSDRHLKQDYHSNQVSIALGSGGLFGVGISQSRQKYNYLPEVATDSIFAIVGEEMGFFGSSILVIVFLILIYTGFMISINCSDTSAKYVSLGITLWICIQFFINIFSMIRFIPLTGVPLPLISYGGSSLIISMSGLGLLANLGNKS